MQGSEEESRGIEGSTADIYLTGDALMSAKLAEALSHALTRAYHDASCPASRIPDTAAPCTCDLNTDRLGWRRLILEHRMRSRPPLPLLK